MWRVNFHWNEAKKRKRICLCDKQNRQKDGFPHIFRRLMLKWWSCFISHAWGCLLESFSRRWWSTWEERKRVLFIYIFELLLNKVWCTSSSPVSVWRSLLAQNALLHSRILHSQCGCTAPHPTPPPPAELTSSSVMCSSSTSSLGFPSAFFFSLTFVFHLSGWRFCLVNCAQFFNKKKRKKRKRKREREIERRRCADFSRRSYLSLSSAATSELSF